MIGMNKILGVCPVCSNNLYVTEVKCDKCNTVIRSDFKLSKFDYLSNDEQNFALVFLKNAGNISQIEKELNISYPTVKKYLDSVISHLGFKFEGKMEGLSKEVVYKKLKDGEISFEEAQNFLKEGE
jgi:hypothetical protein